MRQGAFLSKRKTTFPFLFRSKDMNGRLKPGSGERRVLLSPCGLVIRRIVPHIWTTDAVHNRQMLPGDTLVSSLRINNRPGARRANMPR
jgi:hypothetical protein